MENSSSGEMKLLNDIFARLPEMIPNFIDSFSHLCALSHQMWFIILRSGKWLQAIRLLVSTHITAVQYYGVYQVV